MKSKSFQMAKSILLVLCSSLTYSLVVHTFIGPADLMPAGFVGFSRLLSMILEIYFNIRINFLALYWVLQAIMTLVVIRLIGKRFAFLTILQYSLVSLIGLFMKDMQIVDERLLMVIFAGVLGGISSILAIKAGGSTGGTDFFAIYLQNKNGALPVWDYVMYFNYVVLLISGFINGWPSFLYSIVYQTITAVTISTMDSTNKLSSLNIVTSRPDDVTEAIFKKFDRGLTMVWGEGAFTKNPKALLFMTCYSHQVDPIIKTIQEVDGRAFISVTKLERVAGNFIRTKVR